MIVDVTPNSLATVFEASALSTDKLLITVANALRFDRLRREHAELSQQARDEGGAPLQTSEMIG